ncbi:hypothetical protein C427_1213 [Paraglaciecola psychrophila 170]|uniref:Uncharacterized protein n=1 Tax=Paraglaciecola psychrophila 170 TaxID=1129794 RepID=K7A8F8_9ALTE|nr:hypothetical protein C427_1213 [Paraglaciecola psychrophila 170]GAC37048.1 hypothetical protein GPSY_1413 [Paraglaciecola psychrophila 170]
MLLGCIQAVSAQSVTDKLIVALVEKHLPQYCTKKKPHLGKWAPMI